MICALILHRASLSFTFYSYSSPRKIISLFHSLSTLFSFFRNLGQIYQMDLKICCYYVRAQLYKDCLWAEKCFPYFSFVRLYYDFSHSSVFVVSHLYTFVVHEAANIPPVFRVSRPLINCCANGSYTSKLSLIFQDLFFCCFLCANSFIRHNPSVSVHESHLIES